MRSEELELEMVGNQQAWAECDRADLMLQLLGQMAGTPGWPSRQQVILLACDCVEPALEFVPEGENRPKQAIIDARRLARGEDISPAQVRAAAASAKDYGISSSYTDATYVAFAAASAAYAAANAAEAYDAVNDVVAYIADAYASAAYDAAYDDYPSEDYAFYAASAARDEKLRELADLIRPQFTPVSEHLGLDR